MRRTLAAAVALLATAGCNRGKPAVTPLPPTPTPTPTPPPATEPAPAGSSAAGTYKAEVRNPQTGQPFSTMLLTLAADGSAALDNKMVGSANGIPAVENTATGHYAVDGSELTITLEVGNGKPIPAESPQRVMAFDRSADGRRLTNDAGAPPFVRQP